MVECRRTGEIQTAFSSEAVSSEQSRFITIIDKRTGIQGAWNIKTGRAVVSETLTNYSCSAMTVIADALKISDPRRIYLRRKKKGYEELVNQIRELVEEHNQKALDPITFLRIKYPRKIVEEDYEKTRWVISDILFNESVEDFRELILANQVQVELALAGIGVVSLDVFKRAQEGSQVARESMEIAIEEVARYWWQRILKRFAIDPSAEPPKKLERTFNMLLNRLKKQIVGEEGEEVQVFFKSNKDFEKYVVSSCSRAALTYRTRKERFKRQLMSVLGLTLASELESCQYDLSKASPALRDFLFWLPPSLELTLREYIKGWAFDYKPIARAIENLIGRKVVGLTTGRIVKNNLSLIKKYADGLFDSEEEWTRPPRLKWSRDLPVIGKINPQKFEEILIELMLLHDLRVSEKRALRLLSEGISHKETAQDMGKTEGAMKALLHRVYKKLDRIYKAELEEKGYFVVFED